jgi:hypothetical protein
MILKRFFLIGLSLSIVFSFVGCAKDKQENEPKEVVLSGENWVAARSIEFASTSSYAKQLQDQEYGYYQSASAICQLRGQGVASSYEKAQISKDVKDLRYVYIQSPHEGGPSQGGASDNTSLDKYFLSEFHAQEGIDFVEAQSTEVFTSVKCSHSKNFTDLKKGEDQEIEEMKERFSQISQAQSRALTLDSPSALSKAEVSQFKQSLEDKLSINTNALESLKSKLNAADQNGQSSKASQISKIKVLTWLEAEHEIQKQTHVLVNKMFVN